MTRVLPGVYTSINDLSTLPEGQSSLTVGYVLAANRGPVGKVQVVTSPSDFLTKYTFSGAPEVTDDTTFHSILKVLTQTNELYVSRASNGALYGGLVVKKETTLGNVIAVGKSAKTITVSGDVTSLITATNIVRVYGTTAVDGRYTVVSSTFSTPNTVITVSEIPVADYTYASGTYPTALKSEQPTPITDISLGTITAVSTGSKQFTVAGDVTDYVLVGDRLQVKDSTGNNGYYTVTTRTFVEGPSGNPGTTEIVVAETVLSATADGELYKNSLVNPSGYTFADDDLFLITGIDQGAYNSDIEIKIVSSTESPDSLTEDNVFTISVYDGTTNTLLETFTVSRVPGAKDTSGNGIYIEDVINESSAYIQVIDNTDIAGANFPCNTTDNAALGGGYNGAAVVTANLVTALELFSDKTIPISILGNGSHEDEIFQQAMIALAEDRQDIFCFLNSKYTDEQATLNSTKATNIVSYKKNDLGSTSYWGCMYASHVKVTDGFNSRQVVIGPDAVAISGWLRTIRTNGYPFAYAGPTDGLVSGATCLWKIGDGSGEAELLNNASVNYIAYDPKQGRYYMQCQNTLQIANSAMRNIGVVLNVLDIKETFAAYFKEYLQKPITTSLRKQILTKGTDYMELVKDQGRVTEYVFQDTSTDTDISNNTLRYLLTLSPTPYAQQIYLVMNIVNQTYDFSILQSA